MKNFNELEFTNSIISKVEDYDRKCHSLDLLFKQHSDEFDNDFVESVQDLTYEQLMLFLKTAKKSIPYVYLFRALAAWIEVNAYNMKYFANNLMHIVVLSLNDDKQELMFDKAIEYMNANATRFCPRKEVMS